MKKQAAQKSAYNRCRQARVWPLLHKHQLVLPQAANDKLLPNKITQIGPKQQSILIMNNSVTLFRSNERMLKPVDYTPLQSNEPRQPLFKLPALPGSLLISIFPTPPTKCMCVTQPLLLIDYRAVPPVPTVVAAPVAYPECNQQDRVAGVIASPITLLPENRDVCHH